MKLDFTVIITLYKTPTAKIKNLKQYNFVNLIIFEQEGSVKSKKNIQKIIKRNFIYFFSKKNIGLSKASNFLLNKVKTKYLLFTQADIIIDRNSILQLFRILKKEKNTIIIAPSYKNKNKNLNHKKPINFVNSLNAACMACDAEKLRYIGFFDEDYFLYWEDIDLFNRVSKSNFKMVIANRIFAKHHSSTSSVMDIKTKYLRTTNFMFGELLFDYKNKKIRTIKILRKLFQNLFLFLINIIILNFKVSIIKIFNIIGILKFMLFLLHKKRLNYI